MTLMSDHESHCREQLRRLRMLAADAPQGGTAGRWQIVAEIRDATRAIIAEAEAMSRAASRNEGSRARGAETFFWVRVARLMTSANEAERAARDGDVSGLRAHLHHFDALTSAIFTVEQAVSEGPQMTLGGPASLLTREARASSPPTAPHRQGSGARTSPCRLNVTLKTNS